MLRFQIFEGKRSGNKETGNFGKGIHNWAESSDITTYMWIQQCIGYSEVYRGQYKGMKGR